MARDKQRVAASPQAPLPPIEESPAIVPTPGAMALPEPEPEPSPDGEASFDVAEGSLPGTVEEFAAPLRPSMDGTAICEVVHGALRRNGEEHPMGALVELPEAEGRELQALGVVRVH
jgi:hypothetical protein